MELIRELMLHVIVLVFFTTLLDLLLPDGTFRSYIKMVMGLFVVMSLLQPTISLLQRDNAVSVQQHIVQNMVMAEATRQSEELSKKQQQLQETIQRYWETAQQEQIQTEYGERE